MAFTVANLYNVPGMPPGFGAYIYKSDTDDREDITASGYFNNADDALNLQPDDIIYVTGDAGFYTLRVDTVSGAGVVTTELGNGPIWVQGSLASMAATTSAWALAPCDGVIRRMKVVVAAAVSDDTTFGLELASANVTDGASAAIVTVAASGAAAGDVGEGEADTANTVAEGDAIEITCGGEGSVAGIAEVYIEIIPA